MIALFLSTLLSCPTCARVLAQVPIENAFIRNIRRHFSMRRSVSFSRGIVHATERKILSANIKCQHYSQRLSFHQVCTFELNCGLKPEEALIADKFYRLRSNLSSHKYANLRISRVRNRNQNNLIAAKREMPRWSAEILLCWELEKVLWISVKCPNWMEKCYGRGRHISWVRMELFWKDLEVDDQIILGALDTNSFVSGPD